MVLETRRIIVNLGEAHKIQAESVQSIKDAAFQLKALMESAKTANADIIENHQLLGSRLDLLEKHWQTYRDQIETMQAALDKALTGFGTEMKASLGKVHGEIDGLLAQSLEHFSGALKEFQATLNSLALLARNDPSNGSKKKGSWLSKG